jgi:thioesterase domain-containing protein
MGTTDMHEFRYVQVTPAQLTANLASLTHGPYADTSISAAADLAAETIRYLNRAAAQGGFSDPTTVAAVTANLATAVYRLPQLLSAISEWLKAEAAAGRIADDHCRPAAQLSASMRATISQATDHADALAGTLSAAHYLALTLNTADPAAPAA